MSINHTAIISINYTTRQPGSTHGHQLIENSQVNSAAPTPSNSPLLYNGSFTQLLPPGASIGNYKIIVYMETEYL